MPGSAPGPLESLTDREMPAAGTLDVLFVMPRLGFLRFFQSTLDLMIERGFNVRLLLESPRVDDPAEREWLAAAERRPNFTCDASDHFRADPFREGRVALRLGMEYVRRLGPAWNEKVAGRPPRLSRAPKLVQRLAKSSLVHSALGLRLFYGALSAIDRALPAPRAAARYVADVAPDVVAICDKGHPGSLSSDYVQAALAQGIPTALCVASWDNLTNRQRTRVVPHALLVWNEHQRQEAVEFHGIPSDRVVLTGAPRFDDWFTWRPRPREEFLARVGLDPARPVILWIGCALNPAETTEAEFVRRWIGELRASGDPLLRTAGVLLRPHPERFQHWLETDYSDLENVAMWPRNGMTFPLGGDAKADYFDSIYHSRVVVGINTSAMIEASIVGRPVLTVLVPEFHDSQLATFHFTYLLQSDGGPVRVAGTMEDHLADLAAALAAPEDSVPEEAVRFVSSFVRPRGLDRQATEVFIEEIEQLAGVDVRPQDDPVWVGVLRVVVVPAGLFLHLFGRQRKRLLRRGRQVRKELRRFAFRVVWKLKKIRKTQRRAVKRLRRLGFRVAAAAGRRVRPAEDEPKPVAPDPTPEP